LKNLKNLKELAVHDHFQISKSFLLLISSSKFLERLTLPTKDFCANDLGSFFGLVNPLKNIKYVEVSMYDYGNFQVPRLDQRFEALYLAKIVPSSSFKSIFDGMPSGEGVRLLFVNEFPLEYTFQPYDIGILMQKFPRLEKLFFSHGKELIKDEQNFKVIQSQWNNIIPLFQMVPHVFFGSPSFNKS
jgi:hypothetical protein